MLRVLSVICGMYNGCILRCDLALQPKKWHCSYVEIITFIFGLNVFFIFSHLIFSHLLSVSFDLCLLVFPYGSLTLFYFILFYLILFDYFWYFHKRNEHEVKSSIFINISSC